MLDSLTAGISPNVPVICVELRGHGNSQPPAPGPSMEMFAGDVLAAAGKLGINRFYVGGHSIGGMLAIEIAGRRPGSVAGAIAIEGWTHHEVLREAFGTGPDTTLTPEQDRIRLEQRKRGLAGFTEAESKAFASVWRQWDGLPILLATKVPILEIWGDRGRPRPSRDVMRIPDRPNIELAWVEGASHALLIQQPEAVAALVNRFIARTELAALAR